MDEKTQILTDEQHVIINMLSGTLADRLSKMMNPFVDELIECAKIVFDVPESKDANELPYQMTRQLVLSKALSDLCAHMIGRAYGELLPQHIVGMTAELAIESFAQGIVNGCKGNLAIKAEITVALENMSGKDKLMHTLARELAARIGQEIIAKHVEAANVPNTDRPRPAFKIV